MAPNNLACASFKGLTSQLFHLQLPLTPRQQDQLLQLLTSTFNQHLEKRYGSLPSTNSNSALSPPTSSAAGQFMTKDLSSLPPSPPKRTLLSSLYRNINAGTFDSNMKYLSSKPKSSSSAQSEQTHFASNAFSPTSSYPASFKAADSHMQAILSNPLFAAKPSACSQSPQPSSRSSRISPVHWQVPNATQLKKATSVYSMMSDPGTWFKGLVASGLADTTTACAYLEAVNWKISAAGTSSHSSQLAAASAARTEAVATVLNWIWASNQIGLNPHFFKTVKLGTFIGRFMGAAGRTTRMIDWLLDPEFDMEVEKAGIHPRLDVSKWKGMVLAGLVDVELVTDRTGLSALNMLLGLTERMSSEATPKKKNFTDPDVSSTIRELHFPAMQIIHHFYSSHRLHSISQVDAAAPGVGLQSPSSSSDLASAYNKLISNIRLYTSRPRLFVPLLKALHPIDPALDPTEGYNYLRSHDHLNLAGSRLVMPRLTLALIVAGGFMARGMAQKAEEVLSLVVTRVGDFVRPDAGQSGVTGSAQTTVAPPEGEKMELSALFASEKASTLDSKRIKAREEEESLAVLDKLFA